ncbi:MAG: BolA family transcriptional regulator [Candidatus Marinimicrobia bacterium]|nr:BolA family transcriptional regulator [Candidatus Neomarinimicrobiota bacterium]
MKNKIEELIKSQLNVSAIEIVDFSAKHKGHKGNDGGGHFQAVIISEDFEGLTLIKRHQKIYSILGDLLKKEIHAFSMKTYTPEEFKNIK